MTGNITEEQFRKFCKDFVEKYEGRNFQELVKSLGGNINVAYCGYVENSLTINTENFGLTFGVNSYSGYTIFGYVKICESVFFDCYAGQGCNDFYTIEDLYKFFKMDYKESKEPSNVSKVTFNIPIETIKEDYIEFLSNKHNLNKESIELKIIM